MRLSLFTVLVCLTGQSAFAQSNDTTARIDKLFSSWNNSTPGGSILVARGEKLLYHKAFGLSDLERNVPNTINTVFEAGSVSKQFTAFSILLLESEGKIKLSDDVRKYVPEVPDYEAPITIQQLLNHTSGLKDWGSVGSLTGWPRGTRNYTLELALHILSKQKTTNFRPGTEYNYSNSNYTLQVAIVERISKQTLEAFTSERIFKPLNMTSTRWRSNFRDVIPGRALAYSPIGEGKYELDMFFENIYGHGGLITTTSDLLKWNRLLETHRIGGDGVYNKRIEHGKLSGGKVLPYAAGLGHGDVNGVAEIGHSGSTGGYRAWLAYYPSKKISVALLSNDADFSPYDAGRQIAEIYFGTGSPPTEPEPKIIAFTDKDIQKWAGTYKSIREFDVFTLDRDGQQLVSNGHALKMSHADTLFLDDLKWVYKKNGNITLINWDTATYRKVPPFDVRSTMSFSGEYFSEETGSGYSVFLKEAKVTIVNKPFEAKQLEPAFRDAFIMDGYILLEFKRNGKGAVSGFDISIPRAERVSFNKIK